MIRRLVDEIKRLREERGLAEEQLAAKDDHLAQVKKLDCELAKWRQIAIEAKKPPVSLEEFIEELDSYFCDSGNCSGDCYRSEVELRGKCIYESLFGGNLEPKDCCP